MLGIPKTLAFSFFRTSRVDFKFAGPHRPTISADTFNGQPLTPSLPYSNPFGTTSLGVGPSKKGNVWNNSPILGFYRARYPLKYNYVLLSSLFVLAASMFTWSSDEKSRMSKRLTKYGMKEVVVAGDGNCLMRAISYQLHGTQDRYPLVRSTIYKWLSRNPNFSPDGSETKLGDFLDTDKYPTWEHYCTAMSNDRYWGDHIALVAAAEAFNTNIWILSSVDAPGNSEPVTMIVPRGGSDKTIYLSHWHENHYNALERIAKQ